MGNEMDFYHETRNTPVKKEKTPLMLQNTIYSQDRPFENYESNNQPI